MRDLLRQRNGVGVVARLKFIVPMYVFCLMVLSLIPAVAADGIVLQIKDAPLREVVMLLTQQSGVNIVIADDSKLDKRVTASLNNVLLENALDHIVKSAGVSYKKMDDGTYIIGGAMADEAAIKPIELGLPPVIEAYSDPVSSKKDWALIQLVHSKASSFLQIFGWDSMGIVDNNIPGRRSARNRVRNNSSGPYVNISGGLVKPKQIQPVAPSMDPSALSGGAGRTADETSGASQYGGGFGGGGGMAGGGGGGIGGRTGGIGGGMAGGGGGGMAGGRTGTGSTGGTGSLMPEGIDVMIPYDLDNSILVKGTEDAIHDLKVLIRQLDIAPKQVEIKAEFIEVSTTDMEKFGIDWQLERLDQSFATAFGPEGNVVFGTRFGNLTAQLKAQLTKDVGRVVNAPIISTINNMMGSISVNREIPYFTTTTTSDNGTVISNSEANFITVDTYLEVTPTINGDGTITLMLAPQVSDTGALVTGPNGEVIPETRNQEIYVTRRVGNGETIVVGGFIRKNESNSIAKIPILADLPIIGSLFRTTSKTQEDRELLIFVTARILPDPQGTGAGESISM